MKYYLNVIYPLMLYLIFGLMNYTLTIIKHCYRRFKLSLLTKRLYMSTNIASLIDLAIAIYSTSMIEREPMHYNEAV